MHAGKVAAATAMDEAKSRAEECERTGNRRGAFEGYADAISIAKRLRFSATASGFLTGLTRNHDPSSPEEVEIVNYLSRGLSRDLEGTKDAVKIKVKAKDGTTYDYPDRYHFIDGLGMVSYGRRVVMSEADYAKVEGKVRKELMALAVSLKADGALIGKPENYVNVNNYAAGGFATFGMTVNREEHGTRIVAEVNAIVDRLVPQAAKRE